VEPGWGHDPHAVLSKKFLEFYIQNVSKGFWRKWHLRWAYLVPKQKGVKKLQVSTLRCSSLANALVLLLSLITALLPELLGYLFTLVLAYPWLYTFGPQDTLPATVGFASLRLLYCNEQVYLPTTPTARLFSIVVTWANQKCSNCRQGRKQ
jgi:hypothetical protein